MTTRDLSNSFSISANMPNKWFFLLVIASLLSGVLTVYYPLEVFAGFLVILLWLVLYRFPAEALAILVVGFYIYPLITDTFGIDTSSTLTAGFYIIVSTAALAGSLRRHPRMLKTALRQRTTLIMLAFSGWIFLNWLVFSLSNEFALKKIASTPWLMLIPFLVPQIVGKQLVERFLKACIAVGAFGVALTALGVVSGAQADAVRLSVSDDVSALGFAYSMAVSALIAIIYSFLSKRTLAKILSVASLLSVIALIVGSGSRGPILALFLGLLAAGVFFKQSGRIYLLLSIGLGILIIVSVLPYVSAAAQARIEALLPSGDTSWASQLFAQSRGYIWLYALKAWQSNPVFGIGVGNYLAYSQNASYWEAADFAHNFVMEILSELGLIGIALFSVIFFNIAQKAVSLARAGRFDWVSMSAVALFVFALVKMSFSGQLQVSVEFWVACGLVVSLTMRTTHRFTKTGVKTSGMG